MGGTEMAGSPTAMQRRQGNKGHSSCRPWCTYVMSVLGTVLPPTACPGAEWTGRWAQGFTVCVWRWPEGLGGADPVGTEPHGEQGASISNPHPWGLAPQLPREGCGLCVAALGCGPQAHQRR